MAIVTGLNGAVLVNKVLKIKYFIHWQTHKKAY